MPQGSRSSLVGLFYLLDSYIRRRQYLYFKYYFGVLFNSRLLNFYTNFFTICRDNNSNNNNKNITGAVSLRMWSRNISMAWGVNFLGSSSGMWWWLVLVFITMRLGTGITIIAILFISSPWAIQPNWKCLQSE